MMVLLSGHLAELGRLALWSGLEVLFSRRWPLLALPAAQDRVAEEGWRSFSLSVRSGESVRRRAALPVGFAPLLSGALRRCAVPLRASVAPGTLFRLPRGLARVPFLLAPEGNDAGLQSFGLLQKVRQERSAVGCRLPNGWSVGEKEMSWPWRRNLDGYKRRTRGRYQGSFEYRQSILWILVDRCVAIALWIFFARRREVAASER